jgi:hypothetical protein
MRRLFSTLVGTALLATLLVSPAAAAGTDGSWEQYPTGASEFQAEVQQPLNTAISSNWSSRSKGAVPVMFKLSSRTGPAAFESIYTDTSTDNDFAYMSFTPAAPLLFKDVTQLKTTYAFTLGDCHGGSLRWSVRVSDTQSVFIYYGDEPSTTDCTTNNQSGVNMTTLGDLRYDTSQVGGTFYDPYAHAVELVGDMPIIRASLVIDSGWAGDQRLTVSDTTVNGNVYQFISSGGGAFAPTCELPDATIEVSKTDPVADGAINEEPVQASLVDSGNAFRVVDCKYQYVLSIPSLKGKGTYRVELQIGGVTVPTPNSVGEKVKFDLK